MKKPPLAKRRAELTGRHQGSGAEHLSAAAPMAHAIRDLGKDDRGGPLAVWGFIVVAEKRPFGYVVISPAVDTTPAVSLGLGASGVGGANCDDHEGKSKLVQL